MKAKRQQPKPALRPDREFAEALTEARTLLSAALTALAEADLSPNHGPPSLDHDPDIDRALGAIGAALTPDDLAHSQLYRALRALKAEQTRRWAAAPQVSPEELERRIAEQQAVDCIREMFCTHCGRGYLMMGWDLNEDGTVKSRDGHCQCGGTAWIYRPHPKRDPATVRVSGPRQPPLDMPAPAPPPKPAEPAKPVQRGFKF